MKAGQCRIICLVQSGARMSIAIVLRGQQIKPIHYGNTGCGVFKEGVQN
jgi:hypothetical protein